MRSSSNVMRPQSPPRFSLLRAFARSTSTCRMASEASARKWARSCPPARGWSATLRYASWTSPVVSRVPPLARRAIWRCAIMRSSSYSCGTSLLSDSRLPLRRIARTAGVFAESVICADRLPDDRRGVAGVRCRVSARAVVNPHEARPHPQPARPLYGCEAPHATTAAAPVHRGEFMQRIPRAVVMGALLALATTACADQITAPNTAPSAGTPARSSVAMERRNAAADWNEVAVSLNGRRLTPPAPPAIRLYAYLGLAQLRAAEDARHSRDHRSVSAAIAGASAAILTSFYPLDAIEIERALAAQRVANEALDVKHFDFAAGEAIGRAAAARVLEYSLTDRVGL